MLYHEDNFWGTETNDNLKGQCQENTQDVEAHSSWTPPACSERPKMWEVVRRRSETEYPSFWAVVDASTRWRASDSRVLVWINDLAGLQKLKVNYALLIPPNRQQDLLWVEVSFGIVCNAESGWDHDRFRAKLSYRIQDSSPVTTWFRNLSLPLCSSNTLQMVTRFIICSAFSCGTQMP